jgi:hypothetical protein
LSSLNRTNTFFQPYPKHFSLKRNRLNKIEGIRMSITGADTDYVDKADPATRARSGKRANVF